MSTNTIVQNLRDARMILSSAPEEQIDLAAFGSQTRCQTLYCALGWLALSDRFKSHMTFEWESSMFLKNRWWYSSATVRSRSGEAYHENWLNELFGPAAFDSLFSYRFGGVWDGEILMQNPKMRDLDLALARIDRQILKLGYCP